MTLRCFTEEHDVESTEKLVCAEQIAELADAMQMRMGPQLTEYVLEYGYLAYESIEFYGVNSKQFLASDMVKQTRYLHEWFPRTRGLAALENCGDGDYFCVDENDFVFEYVTETDTLTPTHTALFDYILHRFEGVT